MRDAEPPHHTIVNELKRQSLVIDHYAKTLELQEHGWHGDCGEQMYLEIRLAITIISYCDYTGV
jgi:hypothetical protein